MDLNFNINTKAELAGAEATAHALEMQIGKAKALKQDYSALQQQLETVKQSIQNLTPELKELMEKEKSVGEATGEANLPRRERLEIIRTLTQSYPMLGEAMRAALSPEVFIAFSLVAAYEIWSERVKTLREMMGGWELPDFSVHAVGVDAAAEGYDKLKTAVAGANTEFNSAAALFERQKAAISAQLTVTKQLIDAQKQMAIADLDIERASGKVTPGQYEARKAMIEKGATDKTIQAEIDARNADLNAKREEVERLKDKSSEEAAKAAQIQPGMNDAALEELINKAKAGAEAVKTQAEENRKRQKLAEEQRDTTGADTLTFAGWGTAIEYSKEFGATTNPEDAAKMSEAAVKQAEQTQAVQEGLIRKLEKQKEERDKHREEAARLAAEHAKKQQELTGDEDPNHVGGITWQNRQDANQMHSNDVVATKTGVARDMEQFKKDAEAIRDQNKIDPEHIAKSRAALSDLAAMLKDSMAAVQELASYHENVTQLRPQVEAMKREAAQLRQKVADQDALLSRIQHGVNNPQG